MLCFFLFDASSWIRGIAKIAEIPPHQAKIGLGGDPGCQTSPKLEIVRYLPLSDPRSSPFIRGKFLGFSDQYHQR
jgi:hypothetical protein